MKSKCDEALDKDEIVDYVGEFDLVIFRRLENPITSPTVELTWLGSG